MLRILARQAGAAGRFTSCGAVEGRPLHRSAASGMSLRQFQTSSDDRDANTVLAVRGPVGGNLSRPCTRKALLPPQAESDRRRRRRSLRHPSSGRDACSRGIRFHPGRRTRRPARRAPRREERRVAANEIGRVSLAGQVDILLRVERLTPPNPELRVLLPARRAGRGSAWNRAGNEASVRLPG